MCQMGFGKLNAKSDTIEYDRKTQDMIRQHRMPCGKYRLSCGKSKMHSVSGRHYGRLPMYSEQSRCYPLFIN